MFEALGLAAPQHRIDPPVGPRDVASVLDKPVAEHPEREALADPHRRLTYAALERGVATAAALFTKLGIGPGDRVAASLPNVCDIVVAFLATLRLGGVWVGINAVLSPGEKRHILGHSGTKLLLVDSRGAWVAEELARELPDLTRVLVIDDPARDGDWAGVFAASEAPAHPRPEIDPFAPAAIMYTSGTTGSPKGVVHSQHNMVTLIAAASVAGSMHPDGVRGVVLPLTITNVLILGPLFALWNGRSCICGQSAKADLLIDWSVRERINTFSAVPTIVYDLLQSERDLPRELHMGSGGAPLPMPIRDAFKARYGYLLDSSYGLTEAPTVVAETRGRDAPAGASGVALPHLTVTIRDADGRVVPSGEVGEICVSAVSEGAWAHIYTPALGYWRDAEKTTALLRGGVMHTGDMGRLDDDGWLYIADRSSELILRGGSYIYPAEVERVLHEHTGVAACALVGKPDARLGMRTVAFVQPKQADADAGKIREELVALCRAELARYKTPDEWIFVAEFPRNAMGKILKPVLRQQLGDGD